MKYVLRYLLQAVIYIVLFILLESLFLKRVNWQMAIIATVVYVLFNIVVSIIENKKKKKNS